jgi:hypothetical protein
MKLELEHIALNLIAIVIKDHRLENDVRSGKGEYKRFAIRIRHLEEIDGKMPNKSRRVKGLWWLRKSVATRRERGSIDPIPDKADWLDQLDPMACR